jgi:hypothetical protein
VRRGCDRRVVEVGGLAVQQISVRLAVAATAAVLITACTSSSVPPTTSAGSTPAPPPRCPTSLAVRAHRIDVELNAKGAPRSIELKVGQRIRVESSSVGSEPAAPIHIVGSPGTLCKITSTTTHSTRSVTLAGDKAGESTLEVYRAVTPPLTYSYHPVEVRVR